MTFKSDPNQAPVPTTISVTDRAFGRPAPVRVVDDL
jgi:hypothetical protein